MILTLLLAGGAVSPLLAAPAKRQSMLASPLWGELPAGSYRVGFRTVFTFDAARTWQKTRDYTGKFSPDPNGRPIQLNVWYPAMSDAAGKQMTLGGYVEQKAPPAFAKLNAIMQQRNRENVESAVTAAQLPALLSTPMAASADAPAATGRFPTILYFGGLNADINSNVVLAEFLASHGYVVASISLLGPSDQQPSQDRTPSDLDAVVRDMEFVLPLLRHKFPADGTKLATIGHSLGAIEAAMLGLRNGNVSAVIGLDGTYGFRGSATVLTTSYGYAPEKMRAAFLDLRRAQGEQEADLDLAPVISFCYADRTLVALTKMHHSDFTSFAMVAHRFQVPIRPVYANTGWNRETAQRGYQHLCRIVLTFLYENVKGDPQSADKLRQIVQHMEGSSFKHIAAQPAPPSPPEIVALASRKGLDGVKTLLTKIAGEQPVSACVDAALCNSYGYDLLGQKRPKEALVVFETVAWAHPTLANAQDSLADGYLALGDKEKARKAIERAIELAPTDATMDAQAKATFIADENRRLNELK